jgi:hypothetical protein
MRNERQEGQERWRSRPPEGVALAAVPGWKRVTVGKNRCVHAANQGSRPCPLDSAKQKLAKHGDWKVDVGRFLGLHPDGQNLVRGWIEKAANSPAASSWVEE